MPRPLDPESKTAQIVILPTSDEMEGNFRKFKKILAKDGITVTEYFYPSIEKKVKEDNPQLHFEPVQGGLILNKTIQPNSSIWTMCKFCQGTGESESGSSCLHCNGQGKYIEDKFHV